MSQDLILKNKGLYTNSNQLSSVPVGALSKANNIVIDKDNVAESRRGFALEANPAVDVINDRITGYQEHLIVHRSSDHTMAYKVNGVGYTNYAGTYLNPDDDLARMQFLQANGNLYFTTSLGIYVLDAYTGPIYQTGMPQGLDGSGVTSGASGVISNNVQVAYRIVWGSRDVNNNLYLGAPSQRIIVANTSGGTRNIDLTFSIPAGITTSDFFQVYRSRESGSSTTEPNDELQLCYESNPTSGQITAKSITFTDSRPVALLGAALYTNASQEGIAQANNEPPFAKDIFAFKNYTFFANIKTKQSIDIKMLAIGGVGLVNGDTIIIDGVTYTGQATEVIASAQFKISTGGSASQNISDTAQSLVRVINQYTGNTLIYAYYTSGYQDLPGQIELTERVISNTPFTVVVSRAQAWDIGAGASTGSVYENGLAWSKDSQPEHVPFAHLQFVGSKNYPIRRILALRDSLFIIKTDGVFRLTGTGGNWTIEPLDTSTHIIAPDSAVVVSNQIFALCDQGIVAISDIGVQVISRPIEDEIAELISLNYDGLKTLSFGVSYDTDRKYILFTVGSESDNNPTQAFVYNTFTQAWTLWLKPALHAFVNGADDMLYLTSPSSNYVLVERKALNFTDYADEEVLGLTIVSSVNKVVTLNSIVGIDVGDVLYQSSSLYSIVVSIDVLNVQVTVNDLKVWIPGSVTILKAIPCSLEYAVDSSQNPGLMKHYQETAILFRDENFLNGTLSFFTDLSGGYQATAIAGSYGGAAWGLFLWGDGNWGGLTRPKPVRVFVPREKSRGSLLSIKLDISNAYSKWSLNGVSIQYEMVSERTTRA